MTMVGVMAVGRGRGRLWRAPDTTASSSDVKFFLLLL